MKPVYIVDGARTPFLKSRNRPGPFAAADLATQAGRTLLVRQPFAPNELDEVILGCAAPSVDEVNIGRVAALRMGCGQKVPGWTVMRNCASGMQAIDSGINNILAGRSKLVLAGGVDALSRAPLLYADKMVLWFSDMAAARTTGQRLALFARMPVAAVLKPVIGIMKGLTDPMVGLLMGQTAENLAHRFGITRTQMDAFSVRSHHRVAKAQADGQLGPGRLVSVSRARRWPPSPCARIPGWRKPGPTASSAPGAAKGKRSTTQAARRTRWTTASAPTLPSNRSRPCGRSSTASTATSPP